VNPLAPIQGRLLTTSSSGIAIDSKGTMKVASTTARNTLRPGNSRNTKANAAIEHSASDSTIVTAVTITELKMKWPIGTRWKAAR
jgi:hypothetical protein